MIPILWNDPWKFLKQDWEERKKKLLKVIISHLSDKSRNILSQYIFNILINSYQKPLFNYISFCKHLDLDEIQRVINTIHEKSKISIINNEIFKLFINENMKFTHLYISGQFNYQIHLIPGIECCFS